MGLSTSRKKRIWPVLRVCLAACGLTLALLAAVYALRGIWPFGADNVAYADAAQFYVPTLYKLWDVLHGEASMAVDWFAGLAENAGASWRAVLSPSNWVFLLVSRDHVLEGLSLYLAVKMAFISLAAALALCLRFPALSGRWKALLAVVYTYSGFVLQYYSNFSWLTVAAAFPLLLYGLELLLREGRCAPYVLAYSYFLFCGTYYAYMAVIYILLFSAGYIGLLLPREKRGDRALRLGAGTLAALGLTACFWVVSASGIAVSSRFKSNMDTGLYSGATTWNLPNIRHTALMLLGMSPVMAILLRALGAQRRLPKAERPARRRVIWFFLYMLAVFAIPMVFTNIDTVWHFGQYNFFPMRYGYMLPATLIAGAALALDEPRRDTADRSSQRWLLLVPVLAWLLSRFLPILTAAYQEYGSVFLTAMGDTAMLGWAAAYVLTGVAFTALYHVLLRQNARIASLTMGAVMLLQVGVDAFGFVAPNDDHAYTHEYDPAYIETADQLYAYFSGQDIAPLSRVKNVDGSLSAGYPDLAGVSAVSSVDSGNSATRLGVYRELGYSVNYFRILDTGGTVFSDMLLGVDRALSALPVDGDLYTPVDTAAGLTVAACRYPGVLGLQYPAGALDDYLSYDELADRLNCLYRAFTGTDGAIAGTLSPDMTASGEGLMSYRLTCTLEEPAFLYLSADGVLMDIAAGGRDVAVPTYLNLQNAVYPAAFNSNLLSLGLFPAGTAEITFSSAQDMTGQVTLLALDKAALDGFSAAARRDGGMAVAYEDGGLTLTVTADGPDRVLFLPLTAGGWQCTVNGSPVSFDYPLATFLGVPLREGENTVRLWRPVRAVRAGAGLWITLLSLALCAGWLILRRRRGIRATALPRPVCTAALAMFYAAAAICVGLVYVVPAVMLITHGVIVGL